MKDRQYLGEYICINAGGSLLKEGNIYKCYTPEESTFMCNVDDFFNIPLVSHSSTRGFYKSRFVPNSKLARVLYGE